MTKKSEKIRLSEAKVLSMQPVPGKAQTLIGDADQPGLFLRITPSGGRSYVFEGSIRGKSLRLTIGAVSDWSLPAARAKVREFQAQIDAGHDPRDLRALDVDRNREELDRRRRALEAAEAEAKRQTLTLADVWPRYIEARSTVWGDHGNPPTEPREPEVEFSRNGGSSTCVSRSSPTARSWLCSSVPRSAKQSLISAAS